MAARAGAPAAAPACAALARGLLLFAWTLGAASPPAAEPGAAGTAGGGALESEEAAGGACAAADEGACAASAPAPGARDPVEQYCDIARRAGAQVHATYCEPCMGQRRLAPFVPEGAAAVRERLRSARANASRARGPRTAWFMTVVKPSGEHADKMARYLDFMRAAVVSGLLNAPGLAPYVVYTYQAGQTFGEVDDFYEWLESAGVRVVPHTLSFGDLLSERAVSQEANLNVGCWSRLDIPRLVTDQLHDEFVRLSIRTDYVLYTDADVMLAGDFPRHRKIRYCSRCPRYPEPSCCGRRLKPEAPKWFLAGSDADMVPHQMNSGVMYLNVRNMAYEMPKLVQYASQRNWDFPHKDNGLLEMYFTRRAVQTKVKLWDQFDDAVYNSRAFMKAAGPSSKIWHWHGFKPADVQCWLGELQAGRAQRFVYDCSDKSQNNKLAAELLQKDPCSFYLHMQLLGQYERLLDIASRIAEYLA